MSSLTISSDYGYVLVSAGVIGLTQLFIGGSVMKLRKKFFKCESYLKQQEVKDMAEKHMVAFQTMPNDLGYPDTGCGLYAKHLPYDQWVEFNNAQRAHYNMIEVSGPVLACMLTAGLRIPRVSAAIGMLFALGRYVYANGYKSKQGADGRMVGAVIGGLSTMALFFSAIATGVATVAGM
uniref:Glutathione transferase n=1 Tax=Chrysotila carterae TaxID=13221 RepID=A0A7S4F139_CHRCT